MQTPEDLYGKPDHRRTTGKKVTLDVKELWCSKFILLKNPQNPFLEKDARLFVRGII